MHEQARHRAAAPSSWGRALVAGAIVALSLSIPIPATQAAETPLPLLALVHDRLVQLMSDRSSSVAETRGLLLEMRSSVRHLSSRLRLVHPVLATTLEERVDDALVQVGGEGELLLSDRAEFEVSYLVPIAESLSEVDDALRGTPR